MQKLMIVDLNNIAFSVRHSCLGRPKTMRQKEQYAMQKIFNDVLGTILYHADKFGRNCLLIASDSKNVWRKDIYTDYKANHNDDFEDFYYDDVINAIGALEEFFRDYTAAMVIAVPRCEADDVIAVWCQNSKNSDNIILSTDRDFIQLINEDTRLYSHVQKEFRTAEDPLFSLFVKCFRGDKSDNIRSAYPKIRETRLEKAWNDDVEMMNLMNEKLQDGSLVSENFDFNLALMDLREQPQDIRVKIYNHFVSYVANKYDEIKAIKFMKNLKLDAFVNVLNKNTVLLRTPLLDCSK